MADVAALMLATLHEVFGERDPERRQAAVARTYAPDVTFTDREGTTHGRAGIEAKAQAVLDEAPGFTFSADGPVHVVGDLGHLAWRFGPEGADPVVRGIDLALVEDGLVSRLWTILLTDGD